MGQYSSYYLYQKFEKRDGQDFIPVYPNTYSVDGNGTMPRVMRIENDEECGYTPYIEPIYRWTVITPTSSPSTYICSNCSDEPIYQWNKAPVTDYICDISTNTKYYKEYYQVSYDGGLTWENVTPTSSRTSDDVIEYNSEDCGYTPPPAPTGYSNQYLTFVATESGTFKFSGTSGNSFISYSLDYGSTWSTLASDTDSPSVSAGDKIMWKGTLTPIHGYGIGKFSSTGLFAVEGNILSLLYGDNFSSQTTLNGTFTFYKLFGECTGLTNSQNLVLPSTTLLYSSYNRMFIGCTNLTAAPVLPATALYTGSYAYMFAGCTSLVTAPSIQATSLGQESLAGMFSGCTSLEYAPAILPATTLAIACYRDMFRECTSLTTSPILPATNLDGAYYCYEHMFTRCTSLTTAPVLPATTLVRDCYPFMFSNCTSLTTAPSLPATTLADNCYQGMFGGCTSLTTAPVLPATTLANNCYQSMFSYCSNLTTAPVLPATTMKSYCYETMFYYCTSLTTAPDLPATTLVNNCYKEMFAYCSSLNYVKCLAVGDGTTGTSFWLMGVASSGTFVKSSSMNNWTRGINGIPTNWTVQNA